MKKIFASLFMVIGIPALAGWLIMLLWNGIVPGLCGAHEVDYIESIGLFFLGQLLSGGFVIGIFMIGGILHHFGHHRHTIHGHWHTMTPEQQREFIERRRAWFGHMHNDEKNHNAKATSEGAEE